MNNGTPKDEKGSDSTYMGLLEDDDSKNYGCVEQCRKYSEKPKESSTATSTFGQQIPGGMDKGRCKNQGEREASHR